VPSFHDAQTPEDVPGGEIVPVLSEQEQREEDLTGLVVELLNTAVTIKRSVALKVLECHMCGGWEGTHVNCPVPVLEQWLASRA
jgi:hypothetical protein